MAATVTIRRWTGSSGSPTKTDITGINTRLASTDAHSTNATTHPVRIPAAGNNYSYWAALRLSCDVAPAGGINNLQFYTDGSSGLPSGLSLVVGKASSYVQATGTSGETGIVLNTTNYSTLSGAPVDAFTYTSGSPLALTGSIGATTGDFGDFIVLQFVVASTATPHTPVQETMYIAYDEF